MDISNLYFILRQTLFFFIPLMIVALGGMFSEKSGTVNIALEGMMIVGAFAGIFFIHEMQVYGLLKSSPQLLLIFAMIIAIIFGILFSVLHAFASINMKANQVISGTALNLLAPALVIYIAKMTLSKSSELGISSGEVSFLNVFRIQSVPFLSKIPVIGDVLFQKTYITTFIGFAILLLSIFVLSKTRFGLRMSACGEHPHAAASSGVNVYKMRWAGVLISGALGGLGGLVYFLPIASSFSGSVAGYGFLALAVMIFGQWKPKRILFAALFFGFFISLTSTYTVIPFLANLKIPNLAYLFKMTPFIATMVALVLTSKKSRAPKAEGIPYETGER